MNLIYKKKISLTPQFHLFTSLSISRNTIIVSYSKIFIYTTGNQKIQMPSYFYMLNTFIKKEWVKKTLIEVMINYFSRNSYSYYEEAIRLGVITVNYQIVDKTYILKQKDSLQHTIHYHEPEPKKIEIISMGNDFLVVNKPPGIACHPCGSYNFFTVTKILGIYEKLACVNRLDVLTSGVLILSFQNATKYHTLMANRKVKKKYLAKVKGKFPEFIKVDEKIERIVKRASIISKAGKPCSTIFKSLCYKDGYSLVECVPITGRTHQIRIHLQSIGFPIVNDPLYNENPELNTISPEPPEPKQPEFCHCDEPIKPCSEMQAFILKNCVKTQTTAFLNENAYICLHAYEYTINGKSYIAPPPQWAKDFKCDSIGN